MFIKNPMDQDKNKLATQQSGVIGADGATQNPGGAAPVSNWTNLNAYIEGNQGAGSQLADKMLEQGSQDVSAASKAGSDFAKSAKEAADAATKKDVWSDVFAKGDISKSTPAQQQAYAAWKADTYDGANDAAHSSGYEGFQGAQGKARDSVAATATDQGQINQLRASMGKGNQSYSGGMSMLDQVLTRQAGGGEKIDSFQNAHGVKDGVSQIGLRASATVGDVNKHINNQKALHSSLNDKAQKALNSRFNGLAADLQNRVENGDFAHTLNRRDIASEAEARALDNLAGFGAHMNDNMRGNISKGTGNSHETNAEVRAAAAAAEERARIEEEARLKQEAEVSAPDLSGLRAGDEVRELVNKNPDPFGGNILSGTVYDDPYLKTKKAIGKLVGGGKFTRPNVKKIF